MSTLFIHQSYASVQKIDSREGLSCCERGLVCECNKMNIYLEGAPFTPVLGLFGAKFSAFWCKMAYVLVQNGLRFGAKCSAFWC